MQFTPVAPFLVDGLMRLSAIFEKKADLRPLVIVDGRLVTGKNLRRRPL
ncbi:hypothetical protein [Bryocella elongata]|nr:hypothetical protein [Bryocella elongata]